MVYAARAGTTAKKRRIARPEKTKHIVIIGGRVLVLCFLQKKHALIQTDHSRVPVTQMLSERTHDVYG